jgi:hypothetical protein
VTEITPSEAQQSLQRIARERQTLADRIRLPGWYLALYVLAALVLFALPALVVAPHHRLATAILPVTIVAASAVLGLLDTVIRHVSGTRLSTDDTRSHPESRRPSLVVLGVVVCGSAATWIAAANASWAVSLVCGLVSAVLLVAARLRAVSAVRRHVSSAPRAAQ